jgi:hypothetical protein
LTVCHCFAEAVFSADSALLVPSSGTLLLRVNDYLASQTLHIENCKCDDDLVAAVQDWTGSVLTWLLVLAALVVGSRRLSGALAHPLNPPALLAAGAALAAAAALRGKRATAARFPASAAVLIAGAALTLPGGSFPATVAFWSVLLAEECWTWRHVLPRGMRWLPRGLAAGDPGPIVAFPHDRPGGPQSGGRDDDPPADDVLQQLTLRRGEDGGRQLFGWLRLPLVAGQRTGNVHVAFCPPLAAAPAVEVEQITGPPCRIKTAQVLPYGARLEVKLAAPAARPGSVLLRFAATAKAEDQDPSIS